MRYTALGDSITFGENATSFAKSYSQLVVAQLNSRSHPHRAVGCVLAHPGWSSYDLLDAAKWQGSAMISQAAVVSVWIGGIDLMNAALTSLRNKQPLNAAQSVNQYKRNMLALLSLIRRESHARILCCTQYNPFPNSSLAAEGIGLLNETTIKAAQSCGAQIAPVHRWFEGKQADLISGYHKGKIEDALSGSLPVHPNDRGHRVIAAGLAPYVIPRK